MTLKFFYFRSLILKFQIMKKTIYLPILLMLVMLFTKSCSTSNDDVSEIQKTENVENQNFSRSLDLGDLHNKGLELYYANNSNTVKADYPEALEKINSYMKNYDTSFFSEVDTEKLINRYNSFKTFQSNRGNVNIKDGYFAETHDMLDYLKENNEISDKSYDFLVSKILIDEDYEITVNDLDNYLKNNDLSLSDRQQIETVQSIFIASSEYWKTSQFSNTNNLSKGDPKSRAVIIADCVGGLLWAETGPFAVIGAAACSLIANES